jgi:phosphate transport system substrate-binding protein
MTIRKNFKLYKKLVLIVAITIVVVTFSGCLGEDEKPKLIQTGSSTVLPLAIAWAEEFNVADISVSGGGSSHGINALLNGEADLGDASRLMKGSDYEKVGCSADLVNEDGTVSAACGGVLPTKWIVAYDVLAVVVNTDNTWATQLNYSQLYEIFTDDNPATYWDDVSGLTYAPHEEIEIYAPDEASGTYDFFFEEIIPKWGKDDQQANSRLDAGDGVYHPSADDNVILNAINENEYAIGYFGFAYYKENKDAVSPVWIAEEKDYEEPSLENVANYPLARPLFIYTDSVPGEGDPVNDYLKYILGEEGQNIVLDVGYVRLSLVSENLVTDQLVKL